MHTTNICLVIVSTTYDVVLCLQQVFKLSESYRRVGHEGMGEGSSREGARTFVIF